MHVFIGECAYVVNVRVVLCSFKRKKCEQVCKRKPQHSKKDTSTACLLSTCGGRKWTEKKPRGFIRSLSHVSPRNAMEKIDTSVAFKKFDTMH